MGCPKHDGIQTNNQGCLRLVTLRKSENTTAIHLLFKVLQLLMDRISHCRCILKLSTDLFGVTTNGYYIKYCVELPPPTGSCVPRYTREHGAGLCLVEFQMVPVKGEKSFSGSFYCTTCTMYPLPWCVPDRPSVHSVPARDLDVNVWFVPCLCRCCMLRNTHR